MAEEAREGIVKTRGTAAKIMLCRDGLPHGFCLCRSPRSTSPRVYGIKTADSGAQHMGRLWLKRWHCGLGSWWASEGLCFVNSFVGQAGPVVDSFLTPDPRDRSQVGNLLPAMGYHEANFRHCIE